MLSLDTRMSGAVSGSDHDSLLVELETPKIRKASKHEEKIDPRVYANREVREEVACVWRKTKKQCIDQGLSRGEVWSHCKARTGY